MPEFVLTLLAREEGSTLEFKRKPYAIYTEDAREKERQRGEMIKDLLALANGNAITAGDTAYLVIGADNKRGDDGKRRLFDVGAPETHRLLPKNILDIINPACEPALEDISCDQVLVEGVHLLVITVHPTPYLHETNRKLETSSSPYTEHSAFVRHNEGVRVASAKEREAISTLKKFRFSESRNPSAISCGTIVGGLTGGALAYSARKRKPDSQDKVSTSVGSGALAGGLLGMTIGSLYKNWFEFRSMLFSVPPAWRLPLIGALILFSFLGTKALDYFLKLVLSFLPKSGVTSHAENE
jgi:hypothetical protein